MLGLFASGRLLSQLSSYFRSRQVRVLLFYFL
jgi:hypothetical protein